MLEFIEIPPDEEFEKLKEKAISLIRQETRESMLEWLRYDNERIMQEMLDELVFGKSVTIVSSVITLEPVVITKSSFTASNDDYTKFSLAA